MTHISFSEIIKSASATDWFARLIANATKLKLRATAWQSGSVARTIFQTFGYAHAFSDYVVSSIAQGAFLDYAASGTATYTDPDGTVITTPVTPDGGPGFLDVLTDGLYNAQRLLLGSAQGTQGFLNKSASTYGPIAAGTLHVSNPATKIQYSTIAAITIPPSTAVGGVIVGAANYFGQVAITTTSAHGLSTGQVVAVDGVLGVPPLAGTWFGTVTVIDSTRLALDATIFSGTYTSGGQTYTIATGQVSADTAGSIGSSTDANGVPATNTVTQLVTTLLGVTTGNVSVFFGADQESNAALAARARLALQSRSPNGPKGAYEFFALSAAQFAAMLTPPRRLGAPITRQKEFAFAADGTVYDFLANQNGAVSDADVATVDAIYQAFATPNAVTSKAVSATNRNAACEVTVWLSSGYISAATRALFQKSIQNYFIDLDIGGDTDPQGTYANIVPREGVAGAIFAAAEDAKIQIQNVAVVLAGRSEDLQLVVNVAILKAEVAVLLPGVPTVNLVAV